MVRRKITGGGPFNGRGITVPVDLKRIECGWITAHYELEGNEFRFKSKANAGHGDCPLREIELDPASPSYKLATTGKR
jgi:hypothetical protein